MEHQASFWAEIRKQIHGSFASASSDDVWLYRRILLPFPPFGGLSIREVIGAEDWESGQIEEVVWRAEIREFVCWVESDDTIYRARLKNHSHSSIEEIVKGWTDQGWRIDEEWQKGKV